MNIKKNIYKNILNKDAFTLLEIIISIAIIGILATTFITIFSSQYVSIIKSGNKNKATYKASGETEKRMSGKDTVDNGMITLNFGTNELTFKVPIGLIEQEETVGSSSSKLKTGIPLVPIIELNPKQVDEGKNEYAVVVTSENLNLKNIKSLSIKDRDGNSPKKVTTSIEDDKLTLKLEGIENQQSPYTLEIEENGSNKKAKSTLHVDLPNFLSIDNNNDKNILISSDGEYWMKKEIKYLGDGSGLNKVIRDKNGFIALGEKELLVMEKNKEYKVLQNNRLPGNKSFLDMVWNGKNYFALSSDRKIYKSTKDSILSTGWDLVDIDYEKIGTITHLKTINENTLAVISDTVENRLINTETLVDKSISGFERIEDIVEGKGGVFATGKDKGIYKANFDAVSEQYTLNSVSKGSVGEMKFNSIIWGGVGDFEEFIVAGESGNILRSSNGEDWNSVTWDSGRPSSDVIFNSVVWGGELNKKKFIAIGTNGNIAFSENGSRWDKKKLDLEFKGVLVSK